MLIKLCGFCHLMDVDAAIAAGADFLGLIFTPESPRCISVDTARLIARYVRGKLQLVGVFRNQSVSTITDVANAVGLDWIQLHGQETPAECQAIPWPIIKALEINPDNFTTPANTIAYPPRVRYLLLDRPKTFPAITGDATEALDAWHTHVRGLTFETPVILAGGLTPENVSRYLHRGLSGVDVASGIEQAIGVKDPDKIQAFCTRVRKSQLL